jgi:hypothetical protein
MARLSLKQKEQLRQDRASMSITDLTEKYGVSKATVHRILANTGEQEMEVNIPTDVPNPVFDDIASVLSGKERAVPDPVKDKDEGRDPIMDKAMSTLAESMFHQEQEVVMPMVRVEDPVERTAVLQRIMLNLDNFAPLFTFIHNRQEFVASLHGKSIADLKGILATMEQTRTTLNLANQIKNTFMMLGKATEVLAPKVFGLKTDGFVDGLMTQRQELDMIFRELAIDYAPKFTFQSKPEVRLAMLYGMTLLSVDNTNRIKEYAESKAEASIPETTQEAFADL